MSLAWITILRCILKAVIRMVKIISSCLQGAEELSNFSAIELNESHCSSGMKLLNCLKVPENTVFPC